MGLRFGILIFCVIAAHVQWPRLIVLQTGGTTLPPLESPPRPYP
jgi:hypothetical protein